MSCCLDEKLMLITLQCDYCFDCVMSNLLWLKSYVTCLKWLIFFVMACGIYDWKEKLKLMIDMQIFCSDMHNVQGTFF
jgi:hypothetical protein